MSEKRSLIKTMANRYEMEPAIFAETIKATCMPSKMAVTDAQFAAFLMVANEYNLNPVIKEIFAFPANGGIQPIVSVDGWMKMINAHPQFDGMTFADHFGDNKQLEAITVQVFRKDRGHPIEVTEYMSECRRKSPTWDKWPARMLRHKAVIQAARYAFGFSGIMEPDEAERFKKAEVVTETKQSGVAGMKSKIINDAPIEDVDYETGEILQAEEV
jgi:phage recombination protein Bet